MYQITGCPQDLLERKPWTPPSHRFKDDTHVPVRIGYDNKVLGEKAKAAQGKWDPKTRAWYIQFGKIEDTELEKFMTAITGLCYHKLVYGIINKFPNSQ